MREALSAGAEAHLLKDGRFQHVVDAINYARDGGTCISPLLGGAAFFEAEAGRKADPLDRLTRREKQVFSHMVNGRRAKDIAPLLQISSKTVDTYRAGLMRKLNIDSLTDLVKFAIDKILTGTTGDD